MCADSNGQGQVLLFITAVFPPVGSPEADHSLHECLQLARRGYEVHVLTKKQESVAAPEPLKVHPIVDRWSWTEVGKIWRLLREIRPDVSVLFFLGTLYQYRTMVLFFPLLAKLASRGSKVVTQFSNFGSGGSDSTSVRNRLRRFAFKRLGRFRYGTLLVLSDGFVVLSEYHAKLLGDIHGNLLRRTEIIPPAPNLPMAEDANAARARGRERLGVGDGEFLISFFGRIYPGKGIEPLVEAVSRVAPQFPFVRMAVIGGYLSAEFYWNMRKSYPQELNAYIEERNLTDSIRWSGEYEWDSEDASEFLYGSDLVVLPLKAGVYLYNSSFGIVCAHGLPTVTTRGTMVESPIKHRENTYLIDDQSPDRIEEALRELLENAELRGRLRSGARDLADEWFSWAGAIRKLEGLFSRA